MYRKKGKHTDAIPSPHYFIPGRQEASCLMDITNFFAGKMAKIMQCREGNGRRAWGN